MDSPANPLMQYVDVALRRKWLILLPTVLCVAAAGYVAVTMPPLYQSETTILVEPQQIPENYVQSTVTGSVKDRLNVISQQILSRTRLESVIEQFDLYPGMRRDRSMDEVIHAMREHIKVDVTPGSSHSRDEAAAAFKLAFTHGNPEVAQQVTMKLASMYIVENLKIRENLARETRSFLDKQLADMEEQLRTVEDSIRVFKQQHMGELPEQLETNLRTMEQLQVQRSSVQESLRDAEARQMALEQQLAETPRVLLGEESNREGLVRQIELRKQELASLMTRYTEQYPDVIRRKNEIRELQKQLLGQETEEDRRARGGEGASSPLNPLYQRLKNRVTENQEDTRGLRESLRQIDAKMKDLESRLASVPQREQELMSLTRDYETIKQSYDSLMERKISAAIAESLESRQKSEQFRILDPANYPQKPVKPDRLAILLIGLAAGLGIGGGLSFLLEFLDRSYRRVEDIKRDVDLPVLAVVPVLSTARELRTRRIRRWVLAGCALGGLLLAGLLALQHAGEIEQALSSLRG